MVEAEEGGGTMAKEVKVMSFKDGEKALSQGMQVFSRS